MGWGSGMKMATEVGAGILTAVGNAKAKPSAKMDVMLKELKQSGIKAPERAVVPSEEVKPPSTPPESQADFMARAKETINKPRNFTPEQQKHAEEVKPLGVEYQSDYKDANGNLVYREYKITDPNSKADNFNISVKPNEDLATRIKQKKVEAGDAPEQVQQPVAQSTEAKGYMPMPAFKLPSGEVLVGDGHIKIVEKHPEIKNMEGIVSGYQTEEGKFITDAELHDYMAQRKIQRDQKAKQ
jgi:hypothetical protein